MSVVEFVKCDHSTVFILVQFICFFTILNSSTRSNERLMITYLFYRQLQHKNIVKFYGVVMDVHNHRLRSLALIFELCSGSLRNHIFKNKACIPWKTATAASVTCRWSKAILDAMEFIHSKNIVHRDLKLDNVLVSQLPRTVKFLISVTPPPKKKK